MTTEIVGREGDLASSTARSIIKRGWAAGRTVRRALPDRKRPEEALTSRDRLFRLAPDLRPFPRSERWQALYV